MIEAPRHTNTGPTGAAHGCQSAGCTAWGAFGFRGAWYCALHRDQGEAALRAWAGSLKRPAPQAPARPSTDGQGALW